MTMSQIEAYEAPRTLEEALRILIANEDRIRPIAGGTDVLVRLKRGMMSPNETMLLNLKKIPELTTVEKTATSDGRPAVRIGAAVTVRTIERDEFIRANVPVLSAVADTMASPQVRATATIGGNVANASPAADLAIPLLLLDAHVETARLGGPKGKKVVAELFPVEEFFTGPGETRLPKGALITALLLPCPDKNTRFNVKKGGVRPAMECAVVSAGCGLTTDGAGVVRDARVAFGAVAPTPVRGRRIEAYLTGKPLTDESITGALALVDQEINPISDVRGGKKYRVELTKALLKVVLYECAGDDEKIHSGRETA